MLKEIFRDSFENFEIYNDLYGKTCMHDWMPKVVFHFQLEIKKLKMRERLEKEERLENREGDIAAQTMGMKVQKL